MKYYSVLFPLAIDGGFVYHSDSEIQPGCRVLVDFKGRKRVGVVWDEKDRPDYETKPIEQVIDKRPVLSKEQIDSLKFFSFYYLSHEGLFLKAALPRKLFEVKENIELENNFIRPAVKGTPFQLTEEQKNALKRVDLGRFGVYLLFGVTGSGKTEVYLRLIEQVLDSHKKVVVLVPEIALTPQYVQVFSDRFTNEAIALIHSRLTKKEKLENWLGFTSGRKPILIGTRSAIFVDFSDVGLVVVDEENDDSYKQENQPAYNAKDVAIYRAKKCNIPVILSSATPSVESLYKAETGKFHMIALTRRVGVDTLPEVEFVQLDRNQILSKKTLEEIKKTLDKNKSVAVLVNRRGFARYLVCNKCGYIFYCPNCSVSLVYHKKEHVLKCHWCDCSYKVPESCPRCGSFDLIDKGEGSQKVEEVLREHFKDSKIQRFDRDVTSKKGEFERILKDLHEGRIDILVGTQMLSKGHDVSKIGLVVVVDFESLFSFPDFRAFEKGVSLVIQTAGRSGRKFPGKVIIQASNPGSHLSDFVKKHDYYGFYREEIKTREIFDYPPFCRIVRVVASSTKKEKAESLINGVYEIVKDDFKVVGPSRCPIFKLRNKFRYHLLIKTHNILKTVAYLREEVSNINGVFFDVDPINFF